MIIAYGFSCAIYLLALCTTHPPAIGIAAQTQHTSDQSKPPQLFFQDLQLHPSPLPSYADLLRAVDQIPNQGNEDVKATVRSVMAALDSSSTDVRLYAALALTSIARRPDGASLLADRLAQIGKQEDAEDSRLQALPAEVFVELRPHPPTSTVPILVAFLRRKDRDTSAQASAVFALVRISPEDAAVRSAIHGFLMRSLDSRTLIGTVNALGDARLDGTKLAADVIPFLENSDSGVRFAAVQTVSRIGGKTLRDAATKLQSLAATDQNPQVRAAATNALERLHRTL